MRHSNLDVVQVSAEESVIIISGIVISCYIVLCF
jgi:hypothetical protein